MTSPLDARVTTEYMEYGEYHNNTDNRNTSPAIEDSRIR